MTTDDLASVAHDLRNPLVVLVGAARRLAGPAQPEDVRTALVDMVERSSAEVEAAIEHLLRVATATELEQTVQRKPVDVTALFGELAARASALHHVEIVCRVETGTVYSDERVLRRILQNLLDNAMHHGASPFHLVMGFTPTAARFEVVDHGRSIDDAARATMFDRFHPGTAPSSGTGLGLHIVQRLAAALGGHVVLVDDPASTRFRVELPQRSD